MINYGPGPASHEIEITVFGPGYGEAIAVHLGEQQWMLIDSCLAPDKATPASHAYLRQIGVPKSAVRTIVASHWHDDHVRGIADLIGHYPDAEFMLSSVFSDQEATAFLAAYCGKSAPSLARGSKELFSAISAREVVYHMQQRSSVLELTANGRSIRVTALSPTPAAVAQSVAHFATYVPREPVSMSIGHAPELKPNLESVVLHIDFGSDAALLGSDLENHATLGWSAVVSDSWSAQRPPSNAYKIAHHGSSTGDYPLVWLNMLSQDPVACLTPYSLAGKYLPTVTDRERIKAHTPYAYISSVATRKPDMDSAVLRRLHDICSNVTRANSGFGAVRLRKTIDSQGWTHELFGAAGAL